jgi:hypothetical protein
MTDIAGFTEIMRSNEPQTLPLLKADMEVIRAHIFRQGGEVVKVAGDGLLALFGSAPSAVRACIDAQAELAGSPLKHRMAIHAGEVTVSGGDAYGDAINVCSRLEAATIPGSVFASRIVIDLIKAQGLPTPSSLGRMPLKGVSNPFEVFSWGESRQGMRTSLRSLIVGIVASLILVSGLCIAYYQKQSQLHTSRSRTGHRSRLPPAPQAITYNGSNNAQATNSDSISADELMDQAYDEVWQEVEDFELKKEEAIEKVDANIVIQWLRSNSMGQREKGRLEIEHWSLIAVAIKAGKEIAGPNATISQVGNALKSKNEANLELPKEAFFEEFRIQK